MPDHPIIFSAPMVRALLDGRKTQTRRVLKPQPQLNNAGLWRYPPDSACEGDPKRWVKRFGGFCQTDADGVRWFLENPTKGRRLLPYAPGDRLWVREAIDKVSEPGAVFYRADYDAEFGGNSKGLGWRPSIHMPRWASRLTLTVTEVRVQRLREISTQDCIAEGISADLAQAMEAAGRSDLAQRQAYHDTYVSGYRALWNSLHGPDAWDTNPWVVAISFTVRKGNIDNA